MACCRLGSPPPPPLHPHLPQSDYRRRFHPSTPHRAALASPQRSSLFPEEPDCPRHSRSPWSLLSGCQTHLDPVPAIHQTGIVPAVVALIHGHCSLHPACPRLPFFGSSAVEPWSPRA